jgi:Na+/melibiose symporter-like transporter
MLPLSSSALFGIHIHMALVPTILILIGVVVFWRLNDLDRGKNAEIKERLITLGL